tara:strand:+ start:65 stop:1738 length:1674 start_codon:yes stop_codon:yes gene_type:complete
MPRRLIFPILLCLLPTIAAAQNLRGPTLAAASSFGQGLPEGLLAKTLETGIDDLRDELFWYRTEDTAGDFVFDDPMTLYPDALEQAGARLSLLVNNGHASYDDGDTPYSAEAVAGFGRHAAAVVQRFPATRSVEVGNEFNSQMFISGPLKDQDLAARARAYVALLKSVRDQVGAIDPTVRIIGGGVHSIPVAYLKQLVDLGAAELMDSIALHPYDTPVELIAAQIAVMRRLPGLADMPVEITEFGSESRETASADMVRGYCQMALSGVTRMVWYPLNDRGDGYVPLIDASLTPTAAYDTYAYLRAEFEGATVQDAAPDSFTRACLFDGRKLILWGMPRKLTLLSDAVTLRDATGAPLETREAMLSEGDPLILTSETPLVEGRDYVLAPQEVIADSYFQFTYPDGFEGAAMDPLSRSMRDRNGTHPLQTMPGQSGPGRPWTPWLGTPENGDLRLLSRVMLPVGSPDWPVEILHAFTAPEAMTLKVDASFDTVAEDGRIDVTLSAANQPVRTWKDANTVPIEDNTLRLSAGETVEIAVSPAAGSNNTLTRYRITLRKGR